MAEPQVAGWLDRSRYAPSDLGCPPPLRKPLLVILSAAKDLGGGYPLPLATLLEAAGPAAEEQVGRIRARHQQA